MRDCEDSSFKGRTSFKGWTSGFHECFVRSLPTKRAMCRAHDWKMKNRARLYEFASVSRVRPTYEGLAKLSVWQKVMFCFTMSLPTLYIPSLPTNGKMCFSERKP